MVHPPSLILFLKGQIKMPAKLLSKIIEEDSLLKWFKTKNPIIDMLIGEGIPQGRVLLFYGPMSCGKTSATLDIAGMLQKEYNICFYYADVENSSTEKRLCNFLDPELLYYDDEQDFDESINNIREFIFNNKDRRLGIIYDSLDAADFIEDDMKNTKDEDDEDEDEDADKKRKKFKKEKKIKVSPMDAAQRAAHIKKVFRKRLIPLINKYKIVVILVNQAVSNLDMFSGKDFSNTAGRYLNHISACTLIFNRGGKKSHIIENGRRIGVISKIIVEKNKLAGREGCEISLPIYFDKRGIDYIYCFLHTLVLWNVIKTNTDRTKYKYKNEVFKYKRFPEVYEEYKEEFNEIVRNKLMTKDEIEDYNEENCIKVEEEPKIIKEKIKRDEKIIKNKKSKSDNKRGIKLFKKK
jgi:RecA/RadA recombinase